MLNSQTASPTTSAPTVSPTTSFPTDAPTTSSSTTSPNRSQTTTQSTIPSTIQPTTSVAPTSAESDQQQTTPSDDSSVTFIIVIIVLGILLIIAVAVRRQRSSHSPSNTDHQQPTVTENPTFIPEYAMINENVAGVVGHPDRNQDEHGYIASHEPPSVLYAVPYDNSRVYDQAVEMSSQA